MRLILPILVCLGGIASAQKMKVEELYSTHCAGCHGAKFEGGVGGILVDGEWKHGSTDADIFKSIAKGNAQMGMTPWEGILSDDQIRSVVIFLREKEKQTLVKGMEFPKPSPDKVTKTELHEYRIETLVEDGLKNPWAIAFLPDGRRLVTEKSGRLRIISADGKLDPKAIEGIPSVIEHGQGGLMEVAIHPDFAKNGWVYLGFSDGTREKNDKGKDNVQCTTSVVRGRIKDHQWTDQELYARMLPLVSDTETISEAIIRYGLLLPSRGAQHTQRKKRPRQHGGAVAATAAEQPQDDDNNNDSADNETRSELARAALRDLTEAASALLLRGKVDVYQHTRRDLIRKLPTTAAATGESGGEGKSASTLVPSASPNAAIDKDTASAVKWEYMGSGDGLVHGPFTTSDMLQWTQAGYFVGTSAVQVRTVREDKSNNSHTTLTSPTLQDDLLNDLLDDDEDEAEREGENGKGSAPPSPPLVVRGDWQMSDQVDFARFL